MSVDPQALDAARIMGERDGRYGLANYFDTYVVAGVSEECRATYAAAYEAAFVCVSLVPGHYPGDGCTEVQP